MQNILHLIKESLSKKTYQYLLFNTSNKNIVKNLFLFYHDELFTELDSFGFVKYQYKSLGIRLKFFNINKNFEQEDYLLEKITSYSCREKSSSDGELLYNFF